MVRLLERGQSLEECCMRWRKCGYDESAKPLSADLSHSFSPLLDFALSVFRISSIHFNSLFYFYVLTWQIWLLDSCFLLLFCLLFCLTLCDIQDVYYD